MNKNKQYLNKKYVVNEYVNVDINKHGVFVKIDLYYMNYGKEGLSILISCLSLLKEVGFNSIGTSYTTGYYDSIDSIYIELHEELDKIDIEKLLKNAK